MKGIENLKLFLAERELKKQLKSHFRDRNIHNFTTAKTVAILFDADKPEDFNEILEFGKFLEDNHTETELLGLTNSKDIHNDIYLRGGSNILTLKDLNWYYKPVSSIATKFLNTNFDILFILTFDESYPVRYLSTLSRAHFKVGKYTESATNDIDFMINIDKNPKTQYLIAQIKTYIPILKST